MSEESWEIKQATMQHETDEAYRDRDVMLALLASMYPAHLCNVEDSWSLVSLQLPTGTTEWPVKASSRDLFSFLTPVETGELPEWGGHSSEERRDVLTAYARANVEGRGEVSPHQPEAQTATQEPLPTTQAPVEAPKAAAAPKRRGRPRKTAQAAPDTATEA